jgi:dTDP-4-dehydrorhamnose reductase
VRPDVTGSGDVSRVLVTGASGQLAAFVIRAFSDCDVLPFTRSALDVTDPSAVAEAVARAAPQIIISCAGFNDVDGAEDRPIEAIAVNALALRGLARAAEAANAILVHYSSDFVIHSPATEPHDEDARPCPRGVYASSKLLGEWFALDAPRAYVLRVESLFGSPRGWSGRRGTVDQIVDGLEHGREVRVFTDRIVSPSYSADVAAATRHLVLSGAAPGLYHCVNDGHASWYDVARAAADILGVQPRLVPITVDQMPLKVPRPRYCALSTKKLRAAGFQMPTWRDGLTRWLESRESGLE